AVHQGEVVAGQRPTLPLEGEDDAAGVDVLGERLFEQAVAADAVAAGGQEADVVVLGTALPARGGQGDGGANDQPGGADLTGVVGREPPEEVEHALCLPRGQGRRYR